MRQDSTVQTQWSNEKRRAQPHSTVRARGRRASDVWPMLLRAPMSTRAPIICKTITRALPRSIGQTRTREIERSRSTVTRSQNGYAGTGGRRTSQGIAYTDTARESTLSGWTRGRGHKRAVAYRGANGPSLLTKQAQHSTNQYYPQCLHCLMVAMCNWGDSRAGRVFT